MGGQTNEELADALQAVFERMRGSSRLHNTWISLPPPAPCCLIGVVVAEAVTSYPATPCSAVPGELISNRAVEEGIAETYKDEWEAARCEPRISPEILNHPAKIMGAWTQ